MYDIDVPTDGAAFVSGRASCLRFICTGWPGARPIMPSRSHRLARYSCDFPAGEPYPLSGVS